MRSLRLSWDAQKVENSRCYTAKVLSKKEKKKTETKQANKTVLKTGNYESKATI